MNQPQVKPEKQRRVFSADDKEEIRKTSSTHKPLKSPNSTKEKLHELRAKTAAVTPTKLRLNNIKK